MEKRKLLTVVVFCLITGLAFADNVISIDINGQGDANAYTGEAAISGATQWNVFDGGWGAPMGSPQTFIDGVAYLPAINEPNRPGIYASQVWIGDNGQNHDQYSDGITGMMNDGFDANGSPDPCISLLGLGWNEARTNWYTGQPFGGVFDIYVYGTEAGDYTLRTAGGYGPTTLSISGGFNDDFNEGQNYVVFEDVPVDDGNEAMLTYTGNLTGLQLVEATTPTNISNGTLLEASSYAVARDENNRTDEIRLFGPDVAGPNVFYFNTGEWMQYDLNVTQSGKYTIKAYVEVGDDVIDDPGWEMYVNGKYVGDLTRTSTTSGEYKLTGNSVTANLFAGPQTFEWRLDCPDIYFNLQSFQFVRTGAVAMPDCDAVYYEGYNYVSDFTGDCRVDANDLEDIAENWMINFGPDPNDYGVE
ncbi:MAG: hypothetical protein WC374_05985 [Phycisphaerae bacterium]